MSADSPWIQTRDGHRIDLLDPDLSVLPLDEIAHAASCISRFTGHTRPAGYTIAQHMVIVALHLGPDHRLAGVCHDAHEVIVGDMSSPMKRALAMLGGGQAWETLDRIHAHAMRLRLGCCDPLPPAVKVADVRALLTERRDLMGESPAAWVEDGVKIDPFPERIEVWPRERAMREWLGLYRELSGRRSS